jgi:hypothetical protein
MNESASWSDRWTICHCHSWRLFGSESLRFRWRSWDIVMTRILIWTVSQSSKRPACHRSVRERKNSLGWTSMGSYWSERSWQTGIKHEHDYVLLSAILSLQDRATSQGCLILVHECSSSFWTCHAIESCFRQHLSSVDPAERLLREEFRNVVLVEAQYFCSSHVSVLRDLLYVACLEW